MNTILAYFGPGQPLYLLFFVGMIVFFCYFYTANVSFKTEDVADNLKKQNGFVPGIRPGKKTEEYLDYVVARILVLGSAYLSAVLSVARDSAIPIGDPVLLWRHFAADRGFRDHGYDHAGSIALAGAPV